MSGRTEMGRRSFLILVGGTISALTLSNDKTIAQATPQPAVEFNKSSYEKDRKMKNRLLIAYGSRCGSTGGVAEAIGQVLSKAGTAVDVRVVKDVNDLSPYQGVIVGSAIRNGQVAARGCRVCKDTPEHTESGTCSLLCRLSDHEG